MLFFIVKIFFLDECKHQITFSVYDQRSKWIPTLTIPATNNIFGSSNKILWNG